MLGTLHARSSCTRRDIKVEVIVICLAVDSLIVSFKTTKRVARENLMLVVINAQFATGRLIVTLM